MSSWIIYLINILDNIKKAKYLLLFYLCNKRDKRITKFNMENVKIKRL